MEKSIIKFGDIEIEKKKKKKITNIKGLFQKQNKTQILFIGYRDAKILRPLCIFFPKLSAYRRDFDQTKYMSFLIKVDELLENYNEIW